MTHRHTTAWLVASLLLPLAGCLIPQQPYVYQTYPPGGTYAPPPPGAPSAVQPVAPPGTPPIPGQEQPEVLTRGPVNEAFAQPVSEQNQAGIVVASQPPATIVETPPADRPVGGACTWAPGYWSFDSERNSFIWVSGCWRMTPPNMSWVPGYWARVPTGWQWVSGFWTPTGSQEIAYLPAPPAVADIQPPGPPPTPDVFWVPGCWYWHQGRYVSRAGYWLHQQPGWIWSPTHCVWTPRGYVFVDGHWDYALERRGVLFAPVCFPGRVGVGMAFSFTPSITLDIGVVSASLFACPRYEHYYFGDYYDDAYVRIGIYPWFDCVRLGTWYDPVFLYARWDHGRTDPRWEERERHEFTLRHDDRNLRPARTYREQEARVARLPEAQRLSHQLARPLSAVAASPSAAMKFERVGTDTHQKIVKQSADTHAFRDARSNWETVTSPSTTARTLPANPRATPAPVGPETTTSATHTRITSTPASPATFAPDSRSAITIPTVHASSPGAPTATAHEFHPEVQPDRVRIPTGFVAEKSVEKTETPRSIDRTDRTIQSGRGDRSDHNAPGQPTDERRRDRDTDR